MKMKINANIFTESLEAEKLDQLIEDKKDYLLKLDNDFARKKVQEEILFLEELLPIVLNETMVFYHEITKALVKKIHEAVKQDANVLFALIPLTDSTEDTIKVATVNPHWGNPIEGLEISITGRKVEEVAV